MATPDDTTTTLIAEIKQRAMVPSSQKTYENQDILRRATQEMDLYIMPLMKAVREEYFTWEADTTITASGEIDINERAMGGVLRDVLYNSGSGFISIPYLDPEQRERQDDVLVMWSLRWNKIVLYGNPSGTLRQSFYIRPGRLIETSDAGQITAINTGTQTVTLGGLIPSTFIATARTDMISNKQMHPFLALDQSIVSVAGNDVTYASLPTGLAVGDWIALAGESPVVQLPRELFPLLCQKVATTIVQSLGDPKWKDLQAETDMLHRNALNLIQPRVQGEPKKIVTGMNRRWWWNS